MSEDASNLTPQIVLSILGGVVILISEILPFIKSVKSNGLTHLIFNAIKTLYKTREPWRETEPLLQNEYQNDDDNEENNYIVSILDNTSSNSINNPINASNNQGRLEARINDLNKNLHVISSSLQTCVADIQNTRQLKLQQVEMYELNYIINYIKVNYPKKNFSTKQLAKSNKQLLISQGYIVDYDSHTDTYVIKW